MNNNNTDLVYTLVSHPVEPRFLVLLNASGYHLPTISVPKNISNITKQINQSIYNIFGFKAIITEFNILHSLHNYDNILKFCLMEIHDENIKIDNYYWIDKDSIKKSTICSANVELLLNKGFETLEKKITSRDTPIWTQKNWYNETVNWVKNVLNKNKIQMLGEVEQVSVSQLSYLLSVMTSSGVIFIKTSAPVYSHEALLTSTLYRRLPKHIPNILALDAAQNLFLMKDAGGQPLQMVTDITKWENALSTFAKIQISYIDFIDELKVAGCPIINIDEYTYNIDLFLNQLLEIQSHHPKALNEEEKNKVFQVYQMLTNTFRKLREYGIPDTLMHDDFHPYNIHVTDTAYIYLDWASAIISHPFFTMNSFFRSASLIHIDSTTPYSLLRKAYLKPWLIYGNEDKLIDAFQLSQKLAPLFEIIYLFREGIEKAKWPEIEIHLPYIIRRHLYEMRNML